MSGIDIVFAYYNICQWGLCMVSHTQRHSSECRPADCNQTGHIRIESIGQPYNLYSTYLKGQECNLSDYAEAALPRVASLTTDQWHNQKNG